MMEPSIRWNGIHDWYAVMGEKTGADRYAFRLYVQSGVRWIWGRIVDDCGALLSGWREGSAMNKGLLTLLLLFTCFARAQVVDTGNSPIRNNRNRR